MERWARLTLYFGFWFFLVVISTILNILNTNWNDASIFSGTILILFLSILQGCVLESPVQAVFCLIFGGYRRTVKSADGRSFTAILNYNLLATSKDEIDECFENMFEAYMGNLSPNISCVLVSATKTDELRDRELLVRDKYRSMIFDILYQEGIAFCSGSLKDIDPIHMKFIWTRYENVPKTEFRRILLFQICCMFVENFMVIHRVSTVLRKCGQYQDLMLLSEGEMNAFTYCDQKLYSTAARKYGEQMFIYSEDVKNIINRKFNYTLVLDSDTEVPRGTIFALLDIAAAHPDRGIIQPSIALDCKKDATLYMHLEKLRQEINEPLTNSNAAILQQSSFFGKGLLNNKIYIDHILGTKNKLIELVPIDVLSHDTFEASLLRPLYVGSLRLKEAPSYNYVTWSIRERRWNKGEILLAIYFFENIFGRPVRFLQRQLQRSKFVTTKLRTKTKLDFVSSYIAHSALRNMMVKPILLVYIFVHLFGSLIYPYISITFILFLVIVFPKFATCNKRNFKYILIETFASIMQFTPESVTGSIRIIRAFKAILLNNTKWTPQRAVEMEFQNSNAFVLSFYHLWGYSLFAVVLSTTVLIFVEDSYLFLFMMFTVITLPVFTGITSLRMGITSKYRPAVDVAVTNASSTIHSSTDISPRIQSKMKQIRIIQHTGQNDAFYALPIVSIN